MNRHSSSQNAAYQDFASRLCMTGIRCCLYFLLTTAANAFGAATDNWIFGSKAWIDVFSAPATAPLPPLPSLVTSEGSSSISDPDGNLLFYTDGVTVWDRTHQPMANGLGLMGNTSSTHSALIVPCSCDKYFVFTTDAAEHAYANGLRVSIVNMALNGGLGAVTLKNIPLLAPSSEKLAATAAIGGGFWLVAHSMGDNAFHAWRTLGSDTIPASPIDCSLSRAIVSHVGTAYLGGQNDYGQGQMKISPNGNRLAVAAPDIFSGFVEVFQFDPLTGAVTNIPPNSSTTVRDPHLSHAYGIEFSPNGSLLYMTRIGGGTNDLYQYAHVDTLTGKKMIHSFQQFAVDSAHDYTVGALQLATNGNIYIARPKGNGTIGVTGQTYLDALTTPNNLDPLSGYQNVAVSLAVGASSRVGLPTMIAGSFTCGGTLKVCKVAGPGVMVGTSFSFTTGANTFSVPAGPAPGGTCVVAASLPPGPNPTVTVTEIKPQGDVVSSITVAPPGRLVGTPNLLGGSAEVRIGRGVTEVTFTDTRLLQGPTGTPNLPGSANMTIGSDAAKGAQAQTGFLEICKHRIPGENILVGSVTFNVNGVLGPFVVPVGACSPAIEVAVGPAIISETQTPGYPNPTLIGCATIPPDRQVDCNHPAKTSTVTVVPGDVSTMTIAIMVNRHGPDIQ